MRTPVWFALVLLLVVDWTAAGPTNGSAGPDSDGSILGDADIQFRREFGLALATPSQPSPDGLTRYGVSLSDEETREIDRRFEDQDRLDDLLSWASANSGLVGGVWLDQQILGGHGFQVVIQLTPDGAALEAAALSRVPDGIATRVDIVKRSGAGLQATVDGLIAARPALAQTGVALLSVYTDTRNNTVVAEVAGGGTAAVSSIAPDVTVREGAPLTPVACVPAERCTYLPYRGGLQVLDSDLAWQCTSGLWAKSGSLLYMISASHCWRYSLNTNVYRYSSATHLGVWINDSIPGPGMACGPAICYANVEAAYFSPDGPLIPSVKNLVYKNSSDKSLNRPGFRGDSADWVSGGLGGH